MGKIVDNEQFIQGLNQMYSGTKKWGTVRVTIKRLYEEVHQYKQTKEADRKEHQQKLNSQPDHEFDIIVKAANPKKKISTIVKHNQSLEFQKNLVTLMQAQMFKDARVAAKEADKKKKGKKEDTKDLKNPAAEKKVKVPRVEVVKGKKNRKDRRKDLRKDKRRDLKLKRKEEKIKLQQEATSNLPNADTIMKEE